MDSFPIFAVVSDTASKFCSGDLLFKRSRDRDNALYVQVADGEGIIADFVAVDIEKPLIFATISDFTIFRGAEVVAASVGDPCLLVYGDFQSKDFCVVGSLGSHISLSEVENYLNEISFQSHAGSIIEFLTNFIETNEVSGFLRGKIISSEGKDEAKRIAYPFLCAHNDIRSRDLVYFFNECKVLVLKQDKSIYVELPKHAVESKVGPFITHLLELFVPSEVVDFRFQEVRGTQELQAAGTKTAPINSVRAKVEPTIGRRRGQKAKELGIVTGRRIANERKRRGMSREEIAAVLGVSTDRVRRWETMYEDMDI